MNEQLTKIEVAKRQLCTAIDLYFTHKDLVSAWTLGASAYNVLRDLNRAFDSSNMLLKDQLPRAVPTEQRQRVREKIQEIENFLKHADRDANAILDFSPVGRIELLLFDASNVYRQLSGSETVEMVLMRMWFLTNATIQHDGGAVMENWLQKIRRNCGESPTDYRKRLWSEAERTLQTLSATPPNQRLKLTD